MPKESGKRIGIHAESVRIPRRKFAVQENAVEHVDIGSQVEASGSQILEDLNEQGAPVVLKKKEKRASKHELFLERLDASRSPYSKSHMRRLKRKEKEQVASGMHDMKEALSAVEDVIPDAVVDSTTVEEKRPKAPKQNGRIGEGKGATLTKAQRKRVLKVERFRIPRILATPEFSANPFATIRTHAQNTLLKHEPPKA